MYNCLKLKCVLSTGSPLHRENRGNGLKQISFRENTGNFENFAKTQGISLAQVVNSPILKIQDIAIFAAKFLKFS